LVTVGFDFSDRELVFAVLDFSRRISWFCLSPGGLTSRPVSLRQRHARGFRGGFHSTCCLSCGLLDHRHQRFSLGPFPNDRPYDAADGCTYRPTDCPEDCSCRRTGGGFRYWREVVVFVRSGRGARDLDFFVINFGRLVFGAEVRLNPAPRLICASLRVWGFFEILSHLHRLPGVIGATPGVPRARDGLRQSRGEFGSVEC